MSASNDGIYQLILIQKRSMRRYTLFALGAAVLGITVIVVNNQLPNLFLPEVSKGLVGVGTGLISLVGTGIPAMQILKCKDRVDYLNLLETKAHTIERDKSRKNKDEQKWIHSVLRQSIEKGIVG